MSEPKTVLVVDDDTDIVAAATMRLEAAGYDTLAATDGQAAVVVAEARHPDGILMDVNMPVMDGITALKELKDLDSTEDIPVVIMSAEESNRQAAHDAGAEAFVKKPYQSAVMVQVVTDAIIAT
jgi:CheY-like chemotaxis protein